MNILIITPHFYPENFKINDLAIELSKKNKIYIFTQRKFFEKKKKKIKGMEIFYFPAINSKNSSLITVFFNYISIIIFGSLYISQFFKFKIDRIFVFQVSPIFIILPAIILKKIKNIKITCWILDLWPDTFFSFYNNKLFYVINKIFAILCKKIYSKVDTFLISSKGFKKKLSNYAQNKDITYIPQWAEDSFKYVKLKKSKVMNIFITGNIGIAQDPDTIFNLIYNLRNEKIKFFFYGNGRKKNYLKSKLNNSKLNNFVFYDSLSVPKLFKKLKDCELILITLLDKEVFNLTMPARVFSALKCGIPICNISSGEVGNLIKVNKCGISSKAGDYFDATKKILQFQKLTTQKKITIKKKCLSFYNKNFDRKYQYSKIEKILSC